MNLSESLTEWLKTFEINIFNCAQDLCDGFIIASILSQVQPDFFTPQWLSRIDSDTGSDWRLKENNLRKIFDKLNDYYGEILDKSIPQSMSPNVTKIAMFYSEEELGLLLQLVLGCVINGPNKNYFIDIMNGLSREIQEGLQIAIQILDDNIFQKILIHTRTDCGLSTNKTSEEVEILRHKCKEWENLVHTLKEEIDMNAEDSEKLKEEISKYKKHVETLESQAQKDKILMANLKQNVNIMNDELLNGEESKERQRAKYSLLEAEVKNLRQECAELKYSRKTAENDDKDRIRFLEEELNIANEVNHMQVKRIDELKNKVMISEQLQQKSNDSALDELKNESAKLKKQLQELRLKIGEEIHRADKAEDNYANLNEKYSELIKENDEYMTELQRIKEECNRWRNEHKNKSSAYEEDIDYKLPPDSHTSPIPHTSSLDFVLSPIKPYPNSLLAQTILLQTTPINEQMNRELVNDYTSTPNDNHYLRELLQQKDKQIEQMRQEYSTRESLRDTEERLICSAFHRLSLELQRKCSAERLTNRVKNLTYLSTQRQSVKMSATPQTSRFGSTQTSYF